MDNSLNDELKSIINSRIAEAKKDGSGYGHRFSRAEIVRLFSIQDSNENHKEIFEQCFAAFGDDFKLVMPAEYAVLGEIIDREVVSKIVIELVWYKIDQKKKTGVANQLSNNEVYALFGFNTDRNIPIELLMFANDVDTLDPNLKFVRHAETGDVLYSTNEFNECYKMFTYSGLSNKTVALAWQKICNARTGNVVRFSKEEINYIEAADLFARRSKSFNEKEPAYSVEEFFRIMPASLVKETADEFDLSDSLHFFLKLIYVGDCCLKFAPYIVKANKDVIKQNVSQHGNVAIEDLITLIPRDNEAAINDAKLADSLMKRASAGNLLITLCETDSSKMEVKPDIFNDTMFLKSLFSVCSNAEKDEKIAISIMKHSKAFCEDKNAVADAIGATAEAYNLAAERILPDPIIVLTIIKKYENEIKLGRNISVSSRLLNFADTIACDADNKLIIKALDEFSKIDNADIEMRNLMLEKIDKILIEKKKQS